jgi:hypothetical protein
LSSNEVEIVRSWTHLMKLAQMKHGIHRVLQMITTTDINIEIHELEPDELVCCEIAISGKLPPHPIDSHTTGHLRIGFVGLHRHTHETFDTTMSYEDLPVWVDRMLQQEICRDILQFKLLVSI